MACSSLSNSSPAEEILSTAKARKPHDLQNTHPSSLRSERERRDVVFVFEFITVAVVCARRSAPRVLLVEDTQKQSRLRHGARCRRWYVLHRKAHFTRNFFYLSRAKARRTKKVAMSASEKRTHPKKTRFPPRAKEATRTSRRGRVDGLSPRARTIFCTSPVVEKKPQKRITFCGTEGERKRDRRPEKKDLFRSTRRGGAVYLFSERMIQ